MQESDSLKLCKPCMSKVQIMLCVKNAYRQIQIHIIIALKAEFYGTWFSQFSNICLITLLDTTEFYLFIQLFYFIF